MEHLRVVFTVVFMLTCVAAMLFALKDLALGSFAHFGGNYPHAQTKFREGFWWSALLAGAAISAWGVFQTWLAWPLGILAVLDLACSAYLLSVAKRFGPR